MEVSAQNYKIIDLFQILKNYSKNVNLLIIHNLKINNAYSLRSQAA